ncbi:MAG: hydantoinase/oxoprolinase family protein [Anaerolineaceae bacterium]|nr:hydantoinase/oxoprolinase family protein [Anaerolineaceae bacterium]
MDNNSKLRIGIDIGGTFTDFVVYDPLSKQINTFKLLSTPANPALAVLAGLNQIFSDRSDKRATIVHGSTVATNALLEYKGARTALVSTEGFKDILQIGRQNRPSLYDLDVSLPDPLVSEDLRFEVPERVLHTGEVLKDLDSAQVQALTTIIQECGAEAVAICLLFSFLHPEHENMIAHSLRAAGFFVSVSSEIMPEFREYERCSTTVVNAYVSPILGKYLTYLEGALEPGMHLSVMQSNGGAIQPEEARQAGVRCILSGPAGGVVGCEYIGRSLISKEPLRLIGFDMGGTSTDVSLIDGSRQITTEAMVSGHPIHLPMLNIHTIGAGGGSIARVDAGGALRVGPESTGADPGPACYGKGEIATITDANVVLGRLAPELFLGGKIHLDAQRAWRAVESVGKELNMETTRVAMGIIQVANAHMERALRVISVERGWDPRTFTLLSFGGAGGLHAADLARGLGIPKVLIPPLASTLSAYGMLAADVIKDYSQTVMLPGDTRIMKLSALLATMAHRGSTEVLAEGLAMQDIQLERSLDMRYHGQSYELNIPFTSSFLAAFHQEHQASYGYAKPDAKIEIVNLRVRAIGKSTPPPFNVKPLGDSNPEKAFLETRPVVYDHDVVPTPFYKADSLVPGNRLKGPAVVVRSDTTILLNPSDQASVDGLDNIIIEVGQ